MSSQRGQAIVIVGAMLAVLVAIAGLALDGGLLYLEQRKMQSAADLAALAGAQVIPTAGAGGAVSEALAIAAQNGEQSPSSAVAASSPPASGGFQSDPLSVEVTISRAVPTHFVKIIGVSSVDIDVRAVAQAGTDSPPYAVIALDPGANPGIGFGGGGDVITYGAGIMSNSSLASSIKHTAGGSVLIDGPVDAVGGINGVILTTFGNEIKGGQRPFPDPFRDLPPPDYSGYVVRNGSPNNPDTVLVNGGDIMPASARYDLGDPRTFGPGVYYGGIKITSGDYHFAPGVYVLAGGGLQITGGSVDGSGVFFYNTVDGKGKGDPVGITTTGKIQLSPPSTPPYSGGAPNMVFYQDRALSQSTNAFNIEATSETSIAGTIYVPTNQVKITGGGDVGVINGQVIASTVYFGGGSGIAVSYNPTAIARVAGSTLVE